MIAAYAHDICPHDPLKALTVGPVADPEPPPGWVKVDVKAAALNHHDVWSLKGIGLPADRLPMVLGCDAAGVTQDGREVLVHAVIPSPGWTGDETLDPRRTLLSELHQGTLAEHVIVPESNVIDKHPGLSFTEAACLPTAWLTAYRMIFVTGKVRPGQTLLVQGVGGGVTSAAIALGAAAGLRVWATSRSEQKAQRALALGADRVFSSGERLPERVDAVIETVGQATWSHSLKCLKPGGTLVVSGATSGAAPPADLNRVFFLQLKVLGSTMGTATELRDLQQFCVTKNLKPTIDSIISLEDVPHGIQKLNEGNVFGKIVVSMA